MSTEVTYLFCVWMNLAKTHERQIFKQTRIKLLLAYSFRRIIFAGKNLNHVHMALFHEILIFFWLILVDICLKFDFSLYQRNTVLHTHTYIYIYIYISIFIYIYIYICIYIYTPKKHTIHKNKETYIFTSLRWWYWKNSWFQCRVETSLATVFSFSQLYEHIF